MRVRPVPPPGFPGDRPEPKHRTKFPTSRLWPEVDHDRQDLRKRLYREIKKGPITASRAAAIGKISLTDAIDELRLLESWLLCRHTADEMGVIRWRWNPANYWEIGQVPF